MAKRTDIVDMNEVSADTAEQGVQVAGLSRSLTREILQPLMEKGSRGTDYEVKGRTKAFDDAPEGETLDPMGDEVVPEGAVATPDGAPVEQPVGDPEVIPEVSVDSPQEPSIPVDPERVGPVSEDEMTRMLDQREKEIGSAPQVPSPTAKQKAEGVVEQGPFNTRIYDEEGLAATIQSYADKAPELKTQSIKSLYDAAQERGIPVKLLDSIFSGKKMETTVGGDELAVKMAGMITLHDESAIRLDGLMEEMRLGRLNDEGQLELREAIAQHDIIYSEMVNAKRDVARTMNVFKNVKRDRSVPLGEVRAALDELGGADNLRAFAEKYSEVKSQGRAAQNKMLQRSAGWRIYDAAVYSAQSVLLSNPVTHMYNLGATGLSVAMDTPERILAAGVGKIRQRAAKVFGQDYDQDRVYLDDASANAWALLEGFKDGWVLAGRALKQDGAKEVKRNPFRAEYLFGKEISKARGSGLFSRGTASIIDAMGTVYSLPFKALSSSDEFIGGYAARAELLRQAHRVGRQTYDEVIQSGDAEAAMAAAQDAVRNLITDRPVDVQQNIDGFRKMVTMQADPDLNLVSGRALWKTQKFLNSPVFKPLVMFNRTITNIASEGAARSPLFFLSPRFHSEWSKGGASRDMAVSRVALGSGMMLGGYHLAMNDHITGSGPSNTEDRNNLRQMGWQPFSLRFKADDFSPMSVKRLRALIGEDQVTLGKGQFDEDIFVSLSRLEPVNMPFLLSAAFADAIKFSPYDPDDKEASTMAAASAAALAEFSGNIPALTTFSDIMQIANSRSPDAGDKMVDIVNGVVKAYGNFALNATPGANLANSSLGAAFERIIDPTIRSPELNEAQSKWVYEATGETDARKTLAMGAFLESYNRLRSRVPVLSEGVPARLDPLTAEPIGAEKAMAYRFIPARTSTGKPSKLREMMAALNHGVGEPSKVINGVRLPLEIENRYKTLYAKRIRINGMSMGQSILNAVEEKMSLYERRGMKANIGTMHSIIDAEVSKYRAVARQRMFGEMKKDRETETYSMMLTPLRGDKYGLSGDEIEYPDIAQRMRLNANKKIRYGVR
jgi:hypothetical protein